jgi:hypothetical protein
MSTLSKCRTFAFVAPITFAALLSACSASLAPVTTTPEPTSLPSPSLIVSDSLPVAPGITGVSLSKLSPDAQAVFAACHLGDHDQIPIAKVRGVGVIASMKDILHYVPLTGREPQLASRGPVWIVTVHYDMFTPGGPDVMVDPTCIVTGDEAFWYATGGSRNSATGKVTPPESPANAPDRAVPSLAP